MTVTMRSEAYGVAVGDPYTGPEEAWLLAEGYAYQAAYADDAAAVLTGTTNAVNIVTGGVLVLQVDTETYSTTLVAADTPAQAATKIDTALGSVADAAIVSSKLRVTSVATGSDVQIRVVSGAGTTLSNLGLTVNQSANGTEGGPGVANTGAASTTPANDPRLASNREEPGKFPADPDYTDDVGVDKNITDPTEAYESAGNNAEVVDAYDFDPGNNDDEDPDFSGPEANITPATGAAAGGTAVVLLGEGFEEATGVLFDASAGTAFSVVDDTEIRVTTPAHAAGAVNVTVQDPSGNTVLTNGFTYTA